MGDGRSESKSGLVPNVVQRSLITAQGALCGSSPGYSHSPQMTFLDPIPVSGTRERVH